MTHDRKLLPFKPLTPRGWVSFQSHSTPSSSLSFISSSTWLFVFWSCNISPLSPSLLQTLMSQGNGRKCGWHRQWELVYTLINRKCPSFSWNKSRLQGLQFQEFFPLSLRLPREWVWVSLPSLFPRILSSLLVISMGSWERETKNYECEGDKPPASLMSVWRREERLLCFVSSCLVSPKLSLSLEKNCSWEKYKTHNERDSLSCQHHEDDLWLHQRHIWEQQ